MNIKKIFKNAKIFNYGVTNWRQKKQNNTEKRQTMKQLQRQTVSEFIGMLEQRKKPKGATSAITKETRIMSYKKTEPQPLRQLVIEVLDGKQLTAREIAIEMHRKGLIPYPARAIIQPRITELVAAGIVEAVGDKQDEVTDRKVAVYKVV